MITMDGPKQLRRQLKLEPLEQFARLNRPVEVTSALRGIHFLHASTHGDRSIGATMSTPLLLVSSVAALCSSVYSFSTHSLNARPSPFSPPSFL